MAKEDVSAKVSGLMQPYLAEHGLDLYRIEYKKEGPDWVLRVYLDKPAGAETEYVSIEECEEANRFLSEALDREDFIARSYNLEVCSPGLDRELIKDADFERFAGRPVEVKTYEKICGSREHEGILAGKEDGIVTIETDGGKLDIPADKISRINLAVVFRRLSDKKEETMSKEFLDAFADLKKEKNLSQEEIIGAIKDSIENAYRKNYGASNVRVEVDMEEGNVTVFMGMEVVEEVEDDLTQISLEEAKEIYEGYELGDIVEYEIDPKDFNRIAAQGAKQVFVQKNREAERTNSYNEFIEKKGQIVTGKVERINNGTMLISLGRTEGRVPASEQVRTESFKPGDRIKVYVMDVKKENKGPQVLLSRSHPGLVRGLFELEIPEIADGTVEIRGTAREAGSRTKIAVYSNDPNVDPVGACVGNRGARVQNIADELFGEKIDIIVWDDDPAVLISNVLRPAIVEGVYINEDEKAATAVVPEQQLSLAIGREGQNVRLAARVSGWKIDIKSHDQLEEMGFAFDEYEDSEDIEEEFIEDEAAAAETEEVGAVEETSDSEADA